MAVLREEQCMVCGEYHGSGLSCPSMMAGNVPSSNKLVDNQHKHIKGYRDLTEQEIMLMNKVKAKAEELRELLEEIKTVPNIDQRFLAIGTTDLQIGDRKSVV